MPTRVRVDRFVIRATRERGVGAPSSRSLSTASHEATRRLYLRTDRFDARASIRIGCSRILRACSDVRHRIAQWE